MTVPPPRPSDSRRPKPASSVTLTRFPVTRTGSWTRPWENQHDVEAVAAALAPPPPARPQVAVVVDPDDAGEVARATAALACRRSGRIVVHTTPGLQPTPWRLGIEVLCALGKHWDRFAQRCDVPFSLLCTLWLRAEQVRDLVVLRAHHLTGKALAWLLELPAREQLRLWLCAPGPLPNLNTTLGAAVLRLTPDQFLQALPPHAPDCRCDDLNRPASAPARARPRRG
jgi:hypothetical protein